MLSYPPIHEMLKAWRRQEKLTQEQAAKRLKVPLDSLRRWEQGKSEPRGFARTNGILSEISGRRRGSRARQAHQAVEDESEISGRRRGSRARQAEQENKQ
jgi:transcriptional regulator with XRE-family HTH domain